MARIIKNDIIWMDILALDIRIKRKLHLTTDEICLTQEDVELVNTRKYVNLDELAKMVHKAGLKSADAEAELGISRSMFSMAFPANEENKPARGLRMRTIVATLNAIRRRLVSDSFDKILVDESGEENEENISSDN